MSEGTGEHGLHRKRTRLRDGEPVEVYCDWDGDDWPCAGYLAEQAVPIGSTNPPHG